MDRSFVQKRTILSFRWLVQRLVKVSLSTNTKYQLNTPNEAALIGPRAVDASVVRGCLGQVLLQVRVLSQGYLAGPRGCLPGPLRPKHDCI